MKAKLNKMVNTGFVSLLIKKSNLKDLVSDYAFEKTPAIEKEDLLSDYEYEFEEAPATN